MSNQHAFLLLGMSALLLSRQAEQMGRSVSATGWGILGALFMLLSLVVWILEYFA